MSLVPQSVLLATLLFPYWAAASGSEASSYDPTKPLEDPSLIWGTYRPQIYFGIRAAVPESLLSGLLWFSPARYDSFLQARHDCSEGDKIEGYGWKYHNGRSFAVQEIRDVENNYIIETSWIKTGHEAKPGLKGQPGSWAARVRGTVIDPGEQSWGGDVFWPSWLLTCALDRPACSALPHLVLFPRVGTGQL